MKIRIYAGLLVLVLSALFICCDEDRVTSPGGGDDPPVKITRENCVEMLVEAFNEMDIEKYRGLLLKPDTSNVFSDGYIWHNQQEDFMSGYVELESLDYYQDIEATDSLFAHAGEVDLDLYHGAWDSLEVFRGISCADCWETVRRYQMYVYADDWNYYGLFYIRLVIGPDPGISDSYLIYQARDLRRVDSINRLPSDSEDVSLGQIKSIFVDSF
ncbi:MAG: hypothetical protein R6U43_04235 [Candidatus Krumholzibacteriales bacterium]